MFKETFLQLHNHIKTCFKFRCSSEYANPATVHQMEAYPPQSSFKTYNKNQNKNNISNIIDPSIQINPSLFR